MHYFVFNKCNITALGFSGGCAHYGSCGRCGGLCSYCPSVKEKQHNIAYKTLANIMFPFHSCDLFIAHAS